MLIFRLVARLRLARWENRACRRVILGLKNDLLRGASRIRELERTAVLFSDELRRVDELRKRSDTGCARKDGELQSALAIIAELRNELSRLRQRFVRD